MPNSGENPDPRTQDVMAGQDRRISRPDNSLPDWEMPDTAYRPVPIVWFFSAFLAQIFVMALLYAVISGFSPIIALAACLIASGLIGMWTWERGMKHAGIGWKSATIAMLALQFGFVALIGAAQV